jgi:hypothetical protein
MRKWLEGGKASRVLPVLFTLSLLCFQQVTARADSGSSASEASGNPSGLPVDPVVLRAMRNLDRIQSLVDQGALPKKRLDQALRDVDDARDQATLDRDLYGASRIQDLRPEDATEMVAAAERRVERQRLTVDERNQLVDAGVLAKTEIAPQLQELESRQRTLELARDRRLLLGRLVAMAKAEEEFERAREAAITTPKDTMFRFDGATQFHIDDDLKSIDNAYQKEFHAPLPVSAIGQTALHDAMGFDHHGRVDVALNPDQKEGVWLRALLERRGIPYIAFRGAVAGSATAPHIHIGAGSLRLRTASR